MIETWSDICFLFDFPTSLSLSLPLSFSSSDLRIPVCIYRRLHRNSSLSPLPSLTLRWEAAYISAQGTSLLIAGVSHDNFA